MTVQLQHHLAHDAPLSQAHFATLRGIRIMQHAILGMITQPKRKDLHRKDKCPQSDGRGPAPSEMSLFWETFSWEFGTLVEVSDACFAPAVLWKLVGEQTAVSGWS